LTPPLPFEALVTIKVMSVSTFWMSFV